MRVRKLWLIIGTLAMLSLGSTAFGATWNVDVMNLPKLEQYVTDFAGVLDAPTLGALNEHAYNYEQTSGHQFVAVLIPHRQWYELFDISLKIFNDNGIGSKQANDWLLLVIATEEKKIRIVVGYGLEGEMPDVLASQIIEQSVRSLVNSGDYAGAIQAFYARAEQAITSGEGKALVAQTEDQQDNGSFLLLIAFAGFVVGRSLKRSKRSGKKKSYRGVIPMLLLSVFVLYGAVAAIGIVTSIIVYIFAGLIGFVVWPALRFIPSWPRGGFGGGSWGRSGGGSSFGGWFSWGGGSSGGGGAGD